ncbi:hypothetical protein EIP86_008114 [Pleurotus ostreatoroseus]|nr:hypothetical protein EIP86_008114 [Pleurotus ostreatoroseus]
MVGTRQAWSSRDRFEGVRENLDVVNALANFRGTLRELTISEFTLTHLPPGPVYSNVIYLSLKGIVNSLLSILIPALPNVKTLHVDLLVLDEGDPAIRGNNIQYQVEQPAQCWQLSSLVADVHSLWTLSLRRGVPEVKVHNFSLKRDFEYLEPSLVHLRPLQLTFENDREPIFGDNWLSKTITDDWKELARLDFEYIFPAVPNKCDEHLDKLYTQLALVSTSQPNLCVLNICLSPDYREAQSTGFSATCYHLAGLDIYAVASEIARAIPSLALLQLKNVAHKFHWIRQEDGLAPLSPSLTQPDFECLSEGLLAPLRNGEFKK